MIAAQCSHMEAGSLLFLGSIFLLIRSMLLFIWEIKIANTALDVHLSDLEAYEELKISETKAKTGRKKEIDIEWA